MTAEPRNPQSPEEQARQQREGHIDAAEVEGHTPVPGRTPTGEEARKLKEADEADPPEPGSLDPN